jgi:thiol-disulfide isomerase/thioredoxin
MVETADAGLSPARKLSISALVALAIGIGVTFFLAGGGDDGGGTTTAAVTEGDQSSGDAVDVAAASAALAEFRYETVDGLPADLSQFAGRPLVVNFYASWCGPCRAELPDFQTVYTEVGDEIQFTGLAVNDRPEDAQRIIDEAGVTYPVGLDTEFLIEKFDGFAMPSTVFISASGEVLETHLGELSASELRKKIDEFLS